MRMTYCWGSNFRETDLTNQIARFQPSALSPSGTIKKHAIARTSDGLGFVEIPLETEFTILINFSQSNFGEGGRSRLSVLEPAGKLYKQLQLHKQLELLPQ